MYEDYEGSSHPDQLKVQQVSPANAAHPEFTERRTMSRWQFRADQVQLVYQQVQTELIISMLVAAIVSTVFWKLAPPALLLGWTIAIILTVGGRSLFISGRNEDDSIDSISVWGQQYLAGAMLSGICWGSLGVIAAIYGDLVHQIFSLVVLAGISLTAYVSMQSSPKTMAAFIFPALLPSMGWFFYLGETLHLALGTLAALFMIVMLFSARAMRNILAKSFSLGSHNTELIKNLVVTREAAEKSKKYAEQVNIKLQEQIKERQLAEERIRSSEHRMSAIFESMQDTIYQTDTDGNILWISPSVKHLLGYTVKEAVEQNIKTFYVCASDYDDLKHGLDINYGRLQHFETRLVHKDGSHIWISENSHYKYDEHGDITGVEGTIRDITALKHAKEALHQEKERAQVTLRSIGDGVITTDLNGDIEYMNTVAEQATRWKLEDARG